MEERTSLVTVVTKVSSESPPQGTISDKPQHGNDGFFARIIAVDDGDCTKFGFIEQIRCWDFDNNCMMWKDAIDQQTGDHWKQDDAKGSCVNDDGSIDEPIWCDNGPLNVGDIVWVHPGQYLTNPMTNVDEVDYRTVGGTVIARCRLKEDLYSCEDAAAELLRYDGDGNEEVGCEIMVRDPLGTVAGMLLSYDDGSGTYYLPAGSCLYVSSWSGMSDQSGTPERVTWYEPLPPGLCCGSSSEGSEGSEEGSGCDDLCVDIAYGVAAPENDPSGTFTSTDCQTWTNGVWKIAPCAGHDCEKNEWDLTRDGMEGGWYAISMDGEVPNGVWHGWGPVVGKVNINVGSCSGSGSQCDYQMPPCPPDASPDKPYVLVCRGSCPEWVEASSCGASTS